MGLMQWLGLDLGPESDPMAISDDNYKVEVLKSDLPVLLDVWSPGCAPCTALAPTIRRLAAKYQGRVKVAQMNGAANPGISSRLRIRGTPTVVLLKQGSELERVVGIRNQEYFEEMLEERLGTAPTPSQPH